MQQVIGKLKQQMDSTKNFWLSFQTPREFPPILSLTCIPSIGKFCFFCGEKTKPFRFKHAKYIVMF